MTEARDKMRARREAHRFVANVLQAIPPSSLLGMTRVEAVEIQRIHDAHKLAGGIEDDPNLEHHTNGEPGIKPCMCSDCCTQRQQAKESCARCFEAPRRNDPGMSNGLCVFCGYWDIPPGPTREAMRAKRDAQ